MNSMKSLIEIQVSLPQFKSTAYAPTSFGEIKPSTRTDLGFKKGQAVCRKQNVSLVTIINNTTETI